MESPSSGSEGLKFARWTRTAWSIDTVDSTGGMGYFTSSLAFDPSGNPAISYYDGINGDLRYAYLPDTGDTTGPTTLNVSAIPNPALTGTEITLTATVNDSLTGSSNIASAQYQVNGGNFLPMSATDGAFDSVIETVVSSMGALAVGVYDVYVRGLDSAGNVGTADSILLAVYDPGAGFVTGGGWINSPASAYKADPGLTSKVNFGFVSKYKKGADVPTGETEFQFKIADLNFLSDSYQWLVIAGAKAMYKGTGTINGVGNYGFMLSAIDEDLTPSTDVDLFRIKIWDKDNEDSIVYDNQISTEEDANLITSIGGGNIVIHK
ncbi:hypothetical protein ACFLUO_09275 [Chloroflexota bacterium]